MLYDRPGAMASVDRRQDGVESFCSRRRPALRSRFEVEVSGYPRILGDHFPTIDPSPHSTAFAFGINGLNCLRGAGGIHKPRSIARDRRKAQRDASRRNDQPSLRHRHQSLQTGEQVRAVRKFAYQFLEALILSENGSNHVCQFWL